MYIKRSIITFAALILGLYFLTCQCFAADNLHLKTTFSLDRAPRFAIPLERNTWYGQPENNNIYLNTRDRPPTASPGIIIGLNFYDYQQNGSMGRQITGSPTEGWIIMTWMNQNEGIIPSNRGISISAYEVGTGSSVTLPHVTDPDYAGFVSCAWSPGEGSTEIASFVCHVDDGSGVYKTRYYYDGFPSSPYTVLSHVTLFPDPIADWYQPETIWPKMDTHNGDNTGVTDDVIYVLTHVYNNSNDMILYRKVGDAVFDQGRKIETATNLSYTIVADPNSDNVVIVYTDDRMGLSEGEGGQVDLDVYYILSNDQFQTWNTPVCVSNYTEDSLWRAFADLSALYDPQGRLHIIAAVRELRSAQIYEHYKSRLVHWDVDPTTQVVSTASVIDEARYTMPLPSGKLCNPGAWNLYIAKPSVSYCDDKLYALFTKFGGGSIYDCSQAGFANGELFLSASDDAGGSLGRIWGIPWKITDSSTPMCDSSYCESDHWSSMDRYGWVFGDESVKDTLNILYINDKDAGGIPHGEGTWTVNNVLYYRIECRDVVHFQRISLQPDHFTDPTHTAPYTPLPVVLKISNIGGEVLNISGITASDSAGPNPPWINIGSYEAMIPANDFTNVTITLNYDGVLGDVDPSSYGAVIEIDSDAPSDKDYVPIDLTVASDFNMPDEDTISAGCGKKLVLYNTARIGGDNEGYSLNIPDDCDSIDTPPNELMYLFDASPMIAWNDGSDNRAYTTLFNQDFTESNTFRPQSEITWHNTDDYTYARCTVTTSDSLFGVTIDFVAPTDPAYCFVLGRCTFFNWHPVKGAEEVYLGYILDWDIPSDNAVDNGSGFDAEQKTIWQYGADYDTLDQDNMPPACTVPIVETDRLGGIAVYWGEVRNAWTEDNAMFQTNTGHDITNDRNGGDSDNMASSEPDPEYLYAQMSGLDGYNLHGNDTLIDLHTGITFEKVDMTAKAEYMYIFGLITTNQGEAHYLDQVAQAENWGRIHGIIPPGFCLCIPGDANGDGSINVGDAVYTIGYVFKGGPAPIPYYPCSGDANMDCQCNVGDAVYTIAYVFKNGPPPPECDDWIDECGWYE